MRLEQDGAEGIQSFNTEDVVVLAKNFKLTRAQHSLLSKGLSFIPTLDISRDHKAQFQLDMQNYHRKIKLATFYRDSEGRQILPFTGTSTWTPPLEKLPSEIKTLIREDWQIFKNQYKFVAEKCNISLAEVKALRELQHMKHIVLKPADKGSAIVILSREQYILEVERQLNDTEYYKKLDKPIYVDTIPIVRDIVDKLKKDKFINSKQRQYLMGSQEPRERRFYILPKIHKDPTKWTVPFEVPPGRPIVSDCGSETYFTAEYLDHYLNPLSTRHPAYVRDTYHFIEIVKNITISSDFHLFSMDVSSLYTNIPIQSGIDCVKQIFQRYPDPKRPDQQLLQLLDINLRRNDFVFNGKYYLQTKGTAMGKKFAPAYANIFMAIWEEQAIAKCKKKPAYYLRFLDDIWGIWIGSKQEFQEFVDVLNSHDPSIQLTTEIDEQSIHFLDTTVFKGQNFPQTHKLEIKVFFKETDTHALLHRKSFHPKHSFGGIVKSQLLRFYRICSREDNFREAVQILFNALMKRGYGRTFLRHCLKRFLERTNRDHGNFIPLISTFSSGNKLLNTRLKSNFEKFAQRTILPGTKVLSAYRRNKNLKDILIHAKLSPLKVMKPQLLDRQFLKIKFVKNTQQKTVFKIQQVFTPRSRNCIYMIICIKCGIKYVGETKNSLSTRMIQHRYNLRHQKEVDTPLVQHYLYHGSASMRMAGLQRDVNWTDWERKKRERFWIFSLGTKDPFGLNIKNN